MEQLFRWPQSRPFCMRSDTGRIFVQNFNRKAAYLEGQDAALACSITSAIKPVLAAVYASRS